MTRKEEIERLKYVIERLEDERGSDFSGVEALKCALKDIELLSSYERTIRILTAAIVEITKFYGGG